MEELKQINARLAHLEQMLAAATKNVLTFDEALRLTGYSKNYLYTLVRERRVPYSKQGNRLFFAKKDLEEWLMRNRVATVDEIDAHAATYTFLHPRKRI